MAISEIHHNISGDVPIIMSGDDRLGYASFAKHLAESINRMSTGEGLVIVIYGP